MIVEPRKHKALSFVLKNALTNLPDNWNIVIMYGNKNKQFVMDIIDNDLSEYKKRITAKNLNVDNLTISDYNVLLSSKEFYDNIPKRCVCVFERVFTPLKSTSKTHTQRFVPPSKIFVWKP